MGERYWWIQRARSADRRALLVVTEVFGALKGGRQWWMQRARSADRRTLLMDTEGLER